MFSYYINLKKNKKFLLPVVFILSLASCASVEDNSNNQSKNQVPLDDVQKLFSLVMSSNDFLEINDGSSTRIDEEYTYQFIHNPEQLIENSRATSSTTPEICVSDSLLYLPSKKLIEEKIILGYTHSQYAIYPGDSPEEFARIAKNALVSVAEQQFLILNSNEEAQRIFNDISSNLETCRSYKMLRIDNEVAEYSQGLDPVYKNTYLKGINIAVNSIGDKLLIYQINGNVIVRHSFLNNTRTGSNSEFYSFVDTYLNQRMQTLSGLTNTPYESVNVESLSEFTPS
jgi:hypothetical protein